MESATIKIGGMTCAACSNAVERAVKKLEGIETANVNFATEKMEVTYNQTIIERAAIEKAVVKAGYEVVAEEGKKVTIPIGGMTCVTAGI